MLRLRERKGFTLIELMIVIAIIAILAAIAIPQYNAYKRKAKAKDLIGIARNCAQEIAAQCVMQDLVTIGNLASCKIYHSNRENNDISDYIYDVLVDWDSTTGSFNCTNSNESVTVNATARIGSDADTAPEYYAECTVDNSANGPTVTCSGVFKL